MLRFNKNYFFIAVILFLVEILIAKYATGFIRYTLGDYLVVILLYGFIKSFFNILPNKAAITTIVIAFIIEFLQLSDLQNYFPKEYSQIFKLILGTSFSIGDLVAYTLGVITIYMVEEYYKKVKISS